jgi:hypothetical protein
MTKDVRSTRRRMCHILESRQREEKDMTITTQTDRVTGSTVTTFTGNGRRVIAMGSAKTTLPLKVTRDGDGGMRLTVTADRRCHAEKSGIRRRFFWRVCARFGADWSRMTEAQIAFEMRMVSNRRAH